MKKFIAIVFVWSLILSTGGAAYYYLLGNGSLPSDAKGPVSPPSDPKGLGSLPPVAKVPNPAQQPSRKDQTTDILTEEQWNKLTPVTSVTLEPIAYQGTEVKQPDGGDWDMALEKVTELLKSETKYYLRVEGSTSGQDSPANRKLAQERADFVVKLLRERGVPPQRLKAQGMPPGKGKEVGFTVLQAP